jgi:hypothetical protein
VWDVVEFEIEKNIRISLVLNGANTLVTKGEKEFKAQFIDANRTLSRTYPTLCNLKIGRING